MASRFTRIAFDFVIAAIIVLFFTGFGDTTSISSAIHVSLKLLSGTVTGHPTQGSYNDVTWPTIWVSFRLIAMGTIFSCVLGFAHAVFSVRIRQRAVKTANEFVTTLLQSLPEAMYVVLVFVILVYLLEHGINLPGLFYDGIPRFQDTFAPAIALALPGALYLRRILTRRLEDEEQAIYVSTAISKGLSENRAFYTHVLPNILPLTFRQIPVVAGFVISSALFAEFFLGYMGLLFRFPIFVGWSDISGALGMHKQTGIPTYQYGAVFVVGLFLLVCWLLFEMVSEVLSMRLPKDVQPSPTASRRRVDKPWIYTGSVFILIVVLFSTFPKLLTHQNPSKKHLYNPVTLAQPPYPPSPKFLLGTDSKGRDLLAQTLHGTFASLGQGVAITAMVLIGALLLATIAMLHPDGWFSKVVLRIGRIWSAFPVLLVVFLALYNRDVLSHLQELQFICWIAFFEIGRASVSFYGAMLEWNQFGFIEGATSIGQSRIGILYRQLGSWLGHFTLEFAFAEFTRVLSLMTLLAMLHTYAVDKLAYLNGSPPILAIASGQVSWFSILGDETNNVFSIISHPFVIYAPALALTITMLGTSFIARGLRGAK